MKFSVTISHKQLVKILAKHIYDTREIDIDQDTAGFALSEDGKITFSADELDNEEDDD